MSNITNTPKKETKLIKIPIYIVAFFIMLFIFCHNIMSTETTETNADTVKSKVLQPDTNTVVLHTNYGDIMILLYEETPLHRQNFIKLVEEGFYDSLLFHRVIADFMIQGGDPESRNAEKGKRLGMGGPGYTIPAEFVTEYFHKKGVIAAARQGDRVNPQKRSSGSQFYIVQGRIFTNPMLDYIEKEMKIKFSPEKREAYTTIGGTPQLDGNYTVFGEVIMGMDVVDKIANVKTDKYDRPLIDIIIESVEVVK